GVMTINDSTFTENVASTGGAIYNTGTLTIADATFDTNDSVGNGGAIYIDAGTGNGAIETSIDSSTFKNNISEDGCGGAIALITGTVNIDNSVFEGNTAKYYGAIYATGNIVTQDNTVNISNSVFRNNSALGVGAVGLMRKGTIDNVIFENNSATLDSDGAGALFVGAVSELTLSDSKFAGNTSATRGGAIATRAGDLGNNKDAKLDITNTIFDSNIAETTGGAFDNWLYGSKTEPSKVYIGNSTFANNQAKDGAVIYNHGAGDLNDKTALIKIANSVFTDNTAINKAGAIYNENGATIILAGTNTFSGNKANGVLNDIHNDGELNISDSLTLDGGITGNGIVNFTGDTDLVARLQKDSATINGETVSGLDNVTIAGLVVENGLADAEYALVDATTIENQFHEIKVNNALYNFNLDDAANGSILVTRKSVAEQTAGLEEAGLDSSAAKTIAAISGVKTMGNEQVDALFTELTVAAQAGDADAIAQINEVAKAINPESESVVQSAAVSTQNTINNLTAGRMALGHNGGDVDLTAGGVWVQGLYNKSKNADKFSANTRGISAGIDGTINNDIMVGIGYAFGRSDVNAQTRDTDIDSHSVFLYGQYKPGAWYANATLNYTTSKYEESGISIVPVDSEYRANTFGANVATGYDFASGITPELGLRYMHVRTNAYTNSLGMNVDANSTDFLTGIVGARYGFDIMAGDAFLIRPELSAAAKYDMLSDENTATVALPGVNAYTLDGGRLNRFGGEFGAGLTMSYYGFDLSLTYSIDVRKDYTSQTGMAKFRYNF
ncbi:MAG: autotransporter domain-containing protein, partial [Alphaproteobacteria bacterium]